MSAKRIEVCVKCDEPTGNAGRGDGSIYCHRCAVGPLCESCSVSGEEEITCKPCAEKEPPR